LISEEVMFSAICYTLQKRRKLRVCVLRAVQGVKRWG